MKNTIFLIVMFMGLLFSSKLSDPFVQIVHSGIVNDIKTTDNYIITADNLGVIKIWDLNKKRLLKTINVSNNEIKSISVDTNNILILDKKGIIYCYSMINGDFIKKIKLFSSGIKVLSNLKYIVAIGDKNIIKILDKNLKEIKTFNTNKYPIVNADLNSERLVTTGRIVKVWDLKNLKQLKTIPTKSQPNNVRLFSNNYFALYSTDNEPMYKNNRDSTNIFIYNSNSIFDRKYSYYLDNYTKIYNNVINSVIANDKYIYYYKKPLNSNKLFIKKRFKHNCIMAQIDSASLYKNFFIFSFSEHFNKFPQGHLNTITIFNNEKQYNISKEVFDVRDLIVDDKYLYILYAGVRVYDSKILIIDKKNLKVIRTLEPKESCFIDRMASYDKYFFYSHGCSDSREFRFWDFYYKKNWKFIGSMLEEDYDDGEEIIKTSKYYNNKKLRKIATKKLSYFSDNSNKIKKEYKWIVNYLRKNYKNKKLGLDLDVVDIADNSKVVLLKFIVSYGEYYNIILFNKENKKKILSLKSKRFYYKTGRVDTSKKENYALSNENFFYSSKKGILSIYNINGKLISEHKIFDSEITNIFIDGDNLYLSSNNGKVKLFSITNNKIIATIISYETNYMSSNSKKDWLIITPEGYFTGSQGAAQHLNITKYTKDGMEPFDFSQLYDHFFRPDLVKLKLQGKEKEYQKAIKGMTYQEALKNPPPKIEFVGIDGKQVKKDGFEYSVVKTAKDRVKLSFNIKQNQNGGVGIIRVYQEGKLIQTIGKGKINKQSANIDAIVEQEELDKKAKQEQKEYLADATKAIDKNRTIDDTIYKIKDTTLQNKEGVYSIELELKSGNNEIAVEAFNKTNTVTSFRESINIKANIPKQEPKLYAIVCGVNEFEHNNKKLKLKYSVNDAKAIKELLLKNSKKLYKDIEVKYLTEQNLTKENINKAIEDIKQKAKLEDTILFFISTHGRAYKGNLYLLPYNNKKGKDWLRFSELFNKLQSIKSLNQIYIVDACESGKANDIVSSVYDSRASILAKSAGVHILLATTKGTYAFESQDANIKNSVFTAKILKALNNKKTDKNKDNIISIKELSNSLKEKLNTEHQYPVIRNVGKDIGLEKL